VSGWHGPNGFEGERERAGQIEEIQLVKSCAGILAASRKELFVAQANSKIHFNIKPKPWAPFDIIFGNNSKFQYTHYADLGPILGRVTIVDHAPDTLISIANSQSGIEIKVNRGESGEIND